MSLGVLAATAFARHLHALGTSVAEWSAARHGSSTAVEETAGRIFECLRSSLSTLTDENPLREELDGKSKEEQQQIIEQYIARFQIEPSLLERFQVKPPLKEELVKIFLRYTSSQDTFLDRLQMACFDLTTETDVDKRQLINNFIEAYLKHLSFYRTETELTRKIDEGNLDEAKQYLLNIPPQHRKAFFQIIDRFNITILHNAVAMEDESLIDEIFDRLKDLPEEEFKAFLEKEGVFPRSDPLGFKYDNVLSLAVRYGSLKMVNKLIEKFPKDVLAKMLSDSEGKTLLVRAIYFSTEEQNAAKYIERLEILKKIIKEIGDVSPDLQKRCISSKTLLWIIDKRIPESKVANFPFAEIVESILKIVKDDELKFLLLRATTNSNQGLLLVALRQKNKQLERVILKAINQLSSEKQKKLIPSDFLLQKIRMNLETSSVSSFLDFVEFMSLIKDDEVKFSLLSSTKGSNEGILIIAIRQGNEQLALAILSAINQLKYVDKISCLSFALLNFAVLRKMRSLVRELLKTIPQAMKHEYLKKKITYTLEIAGVKKEFQDNALECAIANKDEELAILIFQEILKLDMQYKRDCISSNILYRAILFQMPNLAKLILNSIESEENNLEESYFIEFLQYSEEYIGPMYFGEEKTKNALLLALKFGNAEISTMILECIKKLEINDQIKCLLSNNNIFQYFFYMKDNNLLREIIKDILEHAPAAEIAKIFNEDKVIEAIIFLEYLMELVDENYFVSVFTMIPERYSHIYLSHSLLLKALKARKFVVAFALIQIIKNFDDIGKKRTVVCFYYSSILFEAITKKNIPMIKEILSIFENSTEEQLNFLSFGNSANARALHFAARLHDREARKAIIQILLKAIPEENRLEFLKMKEERNQKSVWSMLEKEELKEYVSPMLPKKKEKSSSHKSSKKAKTEGSGSSSSASSSSATRHHNKKRKVMVENPENQPFSSSSSSSSSASSSSSSSSASSSSSSSSASSNDDKKKRKR